MVAVIDSPGDIATPSVEDAIVATPERRGKDATDNLTSHIVLWSFVAAVVLAIAGFMVVAIYLFRYFNHAVEAFTPPTMGQLASMNTNAMQSMLLARTGLWKFILQSCGIIAGVAFGFLGFALFLLGAKGDMDAAFEDSQHKVQLSRMAPGSFVLFIAAILIGLCSTKSVTLDLPQEETRTVPVQALSPIAEPESRGSIPADPNEATPVDLGHMRLSETGTPKGPRSDTPGH
jgi:hypothetical protein